MRRALLAVAVALVLLAGCGPSLQEQRQRYLDSRPNLPAEIRERINAGKIWMGMTRRQLIASWGFPQDISKSVGRFGTHEQFVYHRSFATAYVYVENNKVTGWQN